MYEKYSDAARRVVVLAQEQCLALGHPTIGTGHILLGLLLEEYGVAGRVLRSLGITGDQVRRHLAPAGEPVRPRSSAKVPFTYTAERLLNISPDALITGTSETGTEHLLLGIIRLDECDAALALLRLGVSDDQLRRCINDERAVPLPD